MPKWTCLAGKLRNHYDYRTRGLRVIVKVLVVVAGDGIGDDIDGFGGNDKRL